MDKKIKLFAVLAIAFILLATPASAYQIKLHGPTSENHIQVSYSWYESAALSNFEAPYAAQKVMNMAKNNHMTFNRNIILKDVRSEKTKSYIVILFLLFISQLIMSDGISQLDRSFYFLT